MSQALQTMPWAIGFGVGLGLLFGVMYTLMHIRVELAKTNITKLEELKLKIESNLLKEKEIESFDRLTMQVTRIYGQIRKE